MGFLARVLALVLLLTFSLSALAMPGMLCAHELETCTETLVHEDTPGLSQSSPMHFCHQSQEQRASAAGSLDGESHPEGVVCCPCVCHLPGLAVSPPLHPLPAVRPEAAVARLVLRLCPGYALSPFRPPLHPLVTAA